MNAWYRTPAEVRATIRKPALAVESSGTSREAAAKIEPQRGRLQTLVWNMIRRAGAAGITDEQGVEATGIPASTYRPRRVELWEQQRIERTGERRRTKSGRRAECWRAR